MNKNLCKNLFIDLSRQNWFPQKWSPQTDFGRNFSKTGPPRPNLAATTGPVGSVWQPKVVPLAKNGPPFIWIVRHAAIDFQPVTEFLHCIHSYLHWHAMALHACFTKLQP